MTVTCVAWKQSRCLAVLEARSPRSRCWQGWTLLRAVRAGSAAGLSLWLVGLSSRPHGALPDYASMSEQTYWVREGPTLLHYGFVLTNDLCKDPMAKSGHILRSWALRLQLATALGLGPCPWSLSCGQNSKVITRVASFMLNLRPLAWWGLWMWQTFRALWSPLQDKQSRMILYHIWYFSLLLVLSY